MRIRITLLTLLICTLPAHAIERDYVQYHKQIASAEEAIFLKNDATAGLALYKKAFDNYDFVYVDDCIEAFQLALFFKRDEYAMQFIRKAIANGFELPLLAHLNYGCPCRFDSEARKKVTIYEPFITRHGAQLQRYADSCYPAYLARLDKTLMHALWKRHVKEQLFKDGHEGLCVVQPKEKSMQAQQVAYAAVCDDNLRFMDSLARKGIYLGEKNMGLYTTHLAAQLHLPTTDDLRKLYLSQYHLPENTYVPVDREEDYFGINPVFNMLFHNTKSYDTIVRYRDVAIRNGYMHPRELASLLYNGHKTMGPVKMHLIPEGEPMANSGIEDELRAQYYLPSYACDSAKHAFAHEHGVKLCFGFRSGTH